LKSLSLLLTPELRGVEDREGTRLLLRRGTGLRLEPGSLLELRRNAQLLGLARPRGRPELRRCRRPPE